VITLVLGGVRSGKSEIAERLAAQAAAATGAPVTYLATGIGDDSDADRVAAHRARRPPSWATIEEPHAVPKVLDETVGIVVVDSLGTWLAHDLDATPIADRADALVAALRGRRATSATIIVSEEVGLGVHPPTEIGRRFADDLGLLNRRVAEIADCVLFVAAGRVVELPPAVETQEHPSTPSTRLRPVHPARSALGLLTVVGGAGPIVHAAADWFAPVGLALGLAVGFGWRALGALGPGLLAAALAVMFDAVLTGGLHLDGLADSADGLLAPMAPARRLEVMRDPHTGAFGVSALVLVLVVRVAALAALAPGRPWLIGAVWCAARGVAAVTVRRSHYARGNGLATPLVDGPAAATAVLAGVLALGAAVPDARHALPAVAAAFVAGIGVHAFAIRRLGGFTGDTLGAGIVVAETAGLVVAALL